MNKKILVIACLIMTTTVFSGCSLLGGDKNKIEIKNENGVEQNQENAESDINNNQENNKEESISCSMQDLIDRNEPLKCFYLHVVGQVETIEITTAADFYVADGKARNEVETFDEERKMEITSIILGEWVYLQHSLLPWSLKIHKNDLQDDVYDQDDVPNLNKKIDFKCQSWTVDNSKFVLPTNVEFEDMTQALKDHQKENPVEEVLTESKNALCDICDGYSDKSKKAECLVKYKCE